MTRTKATRTSTDTAATASATAVSGTEEPRRVYARVFPAQLELPEGQTLPSGRRGTRVALAYLASDGVHVYLTRPRPGQEDTPQWTSRVDWAKTGRFPVPLGRRTPVDVHLLDDDAGDAGVLTLSVAPGCGCTSSLKSWRGPDWGQTLAAQPEPPVTA